MPDPKPVSLLNLYGIKSSLNIKSSIPYNYYVIMHTVLSPTCSISICGPSLLVKIGPLTNPLVSLRN